MARIACPYCYTVQTFEASLECIQCGRAVPRSFIKAARKNAPVYLATVGTTQHGKTTYLDSLMVTIENLGKISRDTYHDYLDDHTFDEVRSTRVQVQNQEKRDITPKTSQPEPLLISLHNFWDNEVNTLVMYDLGGEIFDRRDTIEDYAEPLRHAHTIWFFVSLYDLQHNDRQGRTISDLFNVYRTGMERLGVSTRGRNLLVIYTKADMMVDEWPDEVRRYLQSDPYADLAGLKRRELEGQELDEHAYTQKMLRLSDELKEYTYDDVEGGVPFINMVKQSGMNLAFCVTSSLGREVRGAASKLIEYRRFRVIDPLLWAIDRNRGLDGDLKLTLVLDAGKNATQVFDNSLPTDFYNALSPLGAVSTYFLGTTASAVNVGAPPPTEKPEHNHPALIGPILDQAPPNGQIVVITERSIADLDDFDTPEWHKRLLICTFREGLIKWPRQEVLQRDRNAIESLVERHFKVD